MEKKGVFIIPYYGSFKNYYKFFLESCGHNPDYDWLFITDNKEDYDYPTNVKKITLPFSELVRLVQSKFSTQVELKYAYKLCDLKPMYGYIFEDYIKSYQFWGHCDTDMIFGSINDFISDDDLIEFDKIGVLGHFTLYKNNEQVNKAFMLPLNGVQRYKEVLAADYNMSFDEENKASINSIFDTYDFKVKEDLKLAGLYTKTSNFKLTYPNQDWEYFLEKKRKNIFVWDTGVLNRLCVDNKNKTVKTEEYLYIHFQSRKMKVQTSNHKVYKLIPNSFDDLEIPESKIDYYNFPKSKHFNLHYFRLRTHNLLDKMRKKIMRTKR